MRPPMDSSWPSPLHAGAPETCLAAISSEPLVVSTITRVEPCRNATFGPSDWAPAADVQRKVTASAETKTRTPRAYCRAMAATDRRATESGIEVKAVYTADDAN